MAWGRCRDSTAPARLASPIGGLPQMCEQGFDTPGLDAYTTKTVHAALSHALIENRPFRPHAPPSVAPRHLMSLKSSSPPRLPSLPKSNLGLRVPNSGIIGGGGPAGFVGCCFGASW